MAENTQKKIEFNVLRFIELLKSSKMFIFKFILVGATLGVIVAFSIPKEYESGVTLAPESSSSSSLTSNISSLASMVGMDMNIGGGSDAIYPEIYPDLMQSTDFLVDLFTVKVKSLDGTIDTDYYDYLKHKQKSPWWSYPAIYLSEVTKKFRKSDNRDVKLDSSTRRSFLLSRDEYDVAKAISFLIECQVDKKTSVISITTKAQDPLVAATIADSVKERLQIYITNYRTSKARNDLAYVEKLYDEARNDYKEAEKKYAIYADAHRNTILSAITTEQEDLENEMQLKYNIFTQVAQQLQLAKAKVQERTPAFTVISSATVPVKHCNMKKLSVLMIWSFLAFALSISVLVWKNKKELFTFNF